MILTEMRITTYLKMGNFGSFQAYQVTQMPMKYKTVNRNMDEQLERVREEKHKETQTQTFCKSSSQKNILIETNKNNDRDKTNEHSNENT